MGRHMQQTYLSSPVHFIYFGDQWIVRGLKKTFKRRQIVDK